MTEYPKSGMPFCMKKNVSKKWNRNKIIRSISNIVGAQRIGEL